MLSLAALRLPKLALSVLAAGLLISILPGTGRLAATDSESPVHTSQATYEISAGLDGEIYPVFANYASLRNPQKRTWGTVAVKVSNNSRETLRNRIIVQVPGWSDPEIQSIDLGAGESHTYLFAPTFLRRAYDNQEVTAATVAVTATDLQGRTVDQETLPIRLRSVDDLYWGHDFEYAPFIASWVTPHDPAVERILARAKEFMPGRRMPGYESTNTAVQERLTRRQAAAIYRALQEQGVSYVKSSMTLGRNEDVSERVRMPSESIDRASANCIDGAVLYAALFENLGMDPVIALVPGHAYVGVRLAPASDRYLYIETSLTGRTSFARSVASARRSMAKVPPAEFIRIDIRQARLDGIYPMPSTEPAATGPVLDASRAVGHAGS